MSNLIYALSIMLVTLLSHAAIAHDDERAPNCHHQVKFGEWLWCPVQELMRVWGSPDTIKNLANGNTIILYHQITYQNQLASPIITPVFAGNWGGSIRTMPGLFEANQQHLLRVECVNWFEIDPRGIIVRVKYSNQHCPDRLW